MLAGAIGGALLAPAPVGAVAREIVELQTSVNQLIQGQQAMQTAMTQNDAVEKTLIEQSLDSVNKLSGTMGTLQKTVQDTQANSGARLDSMSTQVQGVSDNLQEMLARMGKLNQQLTDAQNAIQGIDAKLASSAPPPPALRRPSATNAAPRHRAGQPARRSRSRDARRSLLDRIRLGTGSRGAFGRPALFQWPARLERPEVRSGHQEFQDYLQYYPAHRPGLERAVLSGRDCFRARSSMTWPWTRTAR